MTESKGVIADVEHSTGCGSCYRISGQMGTLMRRNAMLGVGVR
ncbi:hypothetical protein [Mycobacterium shinjukuense]|nr:hypothetical protein [Mycobacterium shinjukuense]